MDRINLPLFTLVCEPEGRILEAHGESEAGSAESLLGRLLPSLFVSTHIATVLDFLHKAGSVGYARCEGLQGSDRIGLKDLMLSGISTGERVIVAILRAGTEPGKALESSLRTGLYDPSIPGLLCAMSVEVSFRSSEGAAKEYGQYQKLFSELLDLQKSYAEQNAELERLNDIKEGFLGLIAHDMRSPLIELLSGMQILEKSSERGTERAGIFDEMKAQTERALDFFDELVAWAKLSMGAETPRKALVDLQALAATALETHSQLAATRGVSLESTIPIGSTVLADPDMIAAVFRNLIINALKFTPRGGSVIIQSARQDAGKDIVVSVRDTGFGMDAAELAELFRLGVRTKRGSDNRGRGLGLGLILCKEQVERNGGRIWAESEKGKGSVFYFSLPSL